MLEKEGVVLKAYNNVMEQLVEEIYDNMKDEIGGCQCEQCRSDIIALALNSLPPMYAVTQKGVNISKAKNLSIQHLADIQKAIINASILVAKSPRHTKK